MHREADNNQRPKLPITFYVFSLIVFLLALFYFRQIRTGIQEMEKENMYWLALSIAGQFGTYLFGAMIYFILLKTFPVKKIPEMKALVKANIVSLFFNQAMPMAGISGNTFFFSFLVRYKMAVNDILSLIFVELLTFYAAIEILILFSIGFCLFWTKAPRFCLPVLMLGFIIFLMFGTFIVLTSRKSWMRFFYKRISKINFLKRYIRRLKAGLPGKSTVDHLNLFQIIRKEKKVVLAAVLLQILVFGCDVITLFSLFKGLNYYFPFILVFLGLLLTKIISVLPLSPGALVIYESSMTFFFVSLTAPLSTAVLVTLTYRMLSFWFPIPVGYIIYGRWQKQPNFIKKQEQ